MSRGDQVCPLCRIERSPLGHGEDFTQRCGGVDDGRILFDHALAGRPVINVGWRCLRDFGVLAFYWWRPVLRWRLTFRQPNSSVEQNCSVAVVIIAAIPCNP